MNEAGLNGKGGVTMTYLIMLYWIGQQLFAPTWFWVLWGIACFTKVISFGWDMYKKGAEK